MSLHTLIKKHLFIVLLCTTFFSNAQCPPGDVSFYFQSEINNFAVNYPNCTEIQGGVTIVFNITDLSPLSNIETINGRLEIRQTVLTNLNGLASLTSVSNQVIIGDNDFLTDISGLQNVDMTANNTLEIYDNPDLSVCNLPNFCSFIAGGGTTTISGNGANCISEAAITASCPSLCPDAPTAFALDNVTNESVDLTWTAGDSETEWEVIYGAPNFDPNTEGTTETVNTDPEYTLDGLTAETDYEVYVRAVCTANDKSDWVGPMAFTTLSICPPDDVSFYSQSDLNNFAATYPNCTEIQGNVFMLGPDITDLSPLNTIETVTGYFQIHFTGLTNLNDLASLTSVSNIINIKGNDFLTDISGLQNVNMTTINTLEIYFNPNLSVCNLPNFCSYIADGGATSITDNGANCINEAAITASCPPPCPDVPTAFALANVTTESVDLTWAAGDSETEWEVNYGEPGFDPNTQGTTETVNDDPELTLSGLSLETDYEVYVRAVCTANDKSDWVGPLSLTTLSDLICTGDNWTAHPATENNQWYSVTYGNGRYVAVSTNGTNRVMTSPDGETWMAHPAAENNGWNSVTYGNGKFVAVAITGTNRVMTSLDGETWTAHPAAENNQWRSVTYANGKFVAVSDTGTNRVMTSTDGETWTAHPAAENNLWTSVTYGNGKFVAVSDNGTNGVMTSPDGETWTAHPTAENNRWWSVTYGNGKFVAVSIDGTNRVMTSPDGETWTAQSSVENNSWTSVTYGNGKFVAVSLDGTNRVMTSPDGENWTAQQAAESNYWYSVIYGNGKFVAVEVLGFNRVMVSSCEPPCPAPTAFALDNVTTESVDLTWAAGDSETQWEINYGAPGFDPDTEGTTETVNDDPELTLSGLSLETDYEVYVRAVCGADDESDWVGPLSLTTLSDLVCPADNWTAHPATENNPWQSIAYGNGRFVAVSSSGINRVMTSTDGETWTAHPATEDNQWFSVAYGNGKFVAVSTTGTDRVMTSPDGETWTAQSAAENNHWRSIAYGNGKFVAVASYGINRVMTSTDGETWTAHPAAENIDWRSVTYGNGKFVAVSSNGTNRVMTSPDGENWTAHPATENNEWYSVTYGNGKFVAVANNGTNRVMTSPDGENWAAHPAIENIHWRSVTYGNGKFVAVASSGTNNVMTSSDGETWTTQQPSEFNQWLSVTYGNGKFVAVSFYGSQVMVSSCEPSCAQPTAFALDNVTTESVDLTWAAGDTETQWEVNYGAPNFDPDTEGTTETVNDDPEHILFGLDSGTDYEVYVRAVCGVDDESDWVGPLSFTTLLACPTGNVSLENQAEVIEYAANYSHCPEVNGYFTLEWGVNDVSSLNFITDVDYLTVRYTNGLTSLNGLSSITTVNNDFLLFQNSALTDISALDNITSVGGEFKIEQNHALTAINGFNSLASVGNVNIRSNNNLTAIDGFSSLSNLGTDFEIASNYQLIAVNGFTGLTNVSGNFSIHYNSSIQNFDGLSSMTNVDGDVNVGPGSFTSLDGLSSLSTIGGDLNIYNLEQMADFSDFSSLTTLGGRLTIRGTKTLLNLDNFTSLTSIDDGLTIEYNQDLTSVSGLSSVNSFSGSINFGYNNDLPSLDGLENIPANSITSLGINNNPSLSVCNLPNFCEYLSNDSSTHPRTIVYNYEECLNEVAVLVDCGADLPYNQTQEIYTLTIQDAVEASDCDVQSTVVIPSGDYSDETVDTTAPCWDIFFTVGASPGCATIGSVTLDGSDTIEIEIEGLTACTEYDQYEITNNLALGGAILDVQFLNGYEPDFEDSWIIYNNTFINAVNGTFAGLAEGATFTIAGFEMQISYFGGDGNDIVLTAIDCPDITTTDVETNQDEDIVTDCEYEFTWTEPTFTGGCGITVTRTLDPVYAVSDSYVAGQVVTATTSVVVTTVTYTAEDDSGNEEIFEFTLTANDATDPEITCTTNQTVDTDTDVCTYTHSGTGWDATATDNCSVDTIEYVLTGATLGTGTSLDGVTFNLGTTTVTWTATDGSNNEGECSFTVLVEDNQDPAITCTTNQTVDTDADVCTYTHSGTSWDATATDNCSINAITYTLSGATTGNGTSLDDVTFSLGVTTVSWFTTDGSGNFDLCSYTVTVEDNQDPAITCTTNQTVDTDADVCTYTHSGTDWDATATDNCSVDTIAYVLTGDTTGNGTSLDGVTFNLGTTTVTWTATDGSTNTDVCSYTVTVEDTQDPAITCTTNQTVDTDTDVCTYTHSGTGWDATATDNCSVDTIEYVLTGATLGTGTSLDGVTFNLGTTTVTWTATDGSTNTDVCSYTVTVEDNQAPTAQCVADFTIALDENGQASIDVSDIDNGSDDACGIDTMTISQTDFDCAHVGDNVITLTVTDVNGNVSTCTTTVTVEDVILPEVVCAAPLTVFLDESGEASVVVDDLYIDATDNCAIDQVVADQTFFTCDDLGENTITVTATDVNGNSNTCTVIVAVKDDIAPKLECPQEPIEIDDDSYTVVDFVDEGLVVVSDNCAVASVTQDPAPGTVLGEGTHIITMTATDTSGHQATCSFEVIVDDGLGQADYDIARLTMYPNPANQVINISNPTGISIRSIAIYDLLGKRVQQHRPTTSETISIDVSELPSAVYMVQIIADNGQQIYKRLVKDAK